MSSGDFVLFHKFPPLCPPLRENQRGLPPPGRISGENQGESAGPSSACFTYCPTARPRTYSHSKDSQWKSVTTSWHVLLLQPGQRHEDLLYTSSLSESPLNSSPTPTSSPHPTARPPPRLVSQLSIYTYKIMPSVYLVHYGLAICFCMNEI